MKKMGTFDSKLVFVTKYLIIVIALITAIPLFNTILRPASKLLCAVGCIEFMYLFFRYGNHYKTKDYLFLFFFIGSYIMTIFLNGSHVVNEIAILAYTIMECLFLTYCNKERSFESVLKEQKQFARLYIIVSFIYSVIAMIMFLNNITGAYYYESKPYFYGTPNGQLGGLYNPNTSATICWISIAISMIIIGYKRNYKSKKSIFLFLNIFVQLLTLILSQSRGGLVSLIAFILVYVLFVRTCKNTREVKIRKNILIGLISLALIGGILFVLMNKGVIPGHFGTRGKHTFFTGRERLWQIGIYYGLEVSPVYGVGFRSIDDLLRGYMLEEVYLQVCDGGLHCIYITVLVAAGALGFTFLAIWTVRMLKGIYITWKNNKTESMFIERGLAAIFIACLIGDLVESRLILGFNFMAVIFWLISGYIMCYTKAEEDYLWLA